MNITNAILSAGKISDIKIKSTKFLFCKNLCVFFLMKIPVINRIPAYRSKNIYDSKSICQ